MNAADDDAWMSDNSNSDIDVDEAEPPSSAFDGLSKGFLLKPQAKRQENTHSTQRHQSEPPRTQGVPPRTQCVSATQAESLQKTSVSQIKYTLRDEIFEELGSLTGTYGPASGEAPSAIPWLEIVGFFHRVEKWLLQTSQENESQALERVERAAKRIEETAEKLQNTVLTSTLNYAQMLCRNYTQTSLM